MTTIDGLCVKCGKHFSTNHKYPYTYICMECLKSIELDVPAEINDYMVFGDKIFSIEAVGDQLNVYQYMENDGNIQKVSHQPILSTNGNYEQVKAKLRLLVTLFGPFPIWSNQIYATVRAAQFEKLLEEEEQKWEELMQHLLCQYQLHENAGHSTLAKWYLKIASVVEDIKKDESE